MPCKHGGRNGAKPKRSPRRLERAEARRRARRSSSAPPGLIPIRERPINLIYLLLAEKGLVFTSVAYWNMTIKVFGWKWPFLSKVLASTRFIDPLFGANSIPGPLNDIRNSIEFAILMQALTLLFCGFAMKTAWVDIKLLGLKIMAFITGQEYYIEPPEEDD